MAIERGEGGDLNYPLGSTTAYAGLELTERKEGMMAVAWYPDFPALWIHVSLPEQIANNAGGFVSYQLFSGRVSSAINIAHQLVCDLKLQ